MVNNRIAYIDRAKGVAILLVILGHCCGSAEVPINRFLLSFHMPLFFFLSGMLMKPISSGFLGLLGGVKKKIKSLLVPQLSLLIIQFLYKVALQLISGVHFRDMNFEFILKFWFLPVLFVASVAYMVIDILASKRANVVSLFLSALAIIILQICDLENNNSLLVQLFTVPYALLFYTLGNLVFPNTESISNFLKMKSVGLMTIISIPLVYVLSQINAPVKMYENNYGNLSMFLACASVAILIIIELCQKLNNTPFVEYAGRYSIAIYVWQFITCDIARSICGRLFQTYGTGCQIAIAFIVSTLLSLSIVLISIRYFPQMYSIKEKTHD